MQTFWSFFLFWVVECTVSDVKGDMKLFDAVWEVCVFAIISRCNTLQHSITN